MKKEKLAKQLNRDIVKKLREYRRFKPELLRQEASVMYSNYLIKLLGDSVIGGSAEVWKNRQTLMEIQMIALKNKEKVLDKAGL